MTLLEVLAVIVVLGLAASIVTWRAQRGPAAVLAAGESIARGFDTRARIAAPSLGRVSMSFESDGSLVLRSVEDDRIIAQETLPDRVMIRILALGSSGRVGTIGGTALQAVAFDASGRSIDYAFEIRVDDLSRHLAVSGLTGWTEEVKP